MVVWNIRILGSGIWEMRAGPVVRAGVCGRKRSAESAARTGSVAGLQLTPHDRYRLTAKNRPVTSDAHVHDSAAG